FLITHLPNIQYLCGFSGSAGVLVVRAGEQGARTTFYTDGRYTQQAAEEVQGARVVIASKPALAEACAGLLRAKARVVGFEAQLSDASYDRSGQKFRGKPRLKALQDLIEQLRVSKDSEEIEQIRASVVLGASLFQTALSTIRPGVAESVVAGEMELQARRAGA